MVQLKIKLIYARNYAQAEKETNEALKQLMDKNVLEVKVDTDWANTEDHYICMILYEV